MGRGVQQATVQWDAKVKVKLLSCAQLFATLWTVDCQAPLSIEFSRQEYWSGLPFPTPGDLPNPGIESTSLMSPALACRFFYFFGNSHSV